MTTAQELVSMIDGAFAAAVALRPGWGLPQYLAEKGNEVTGPPPPQLIRIAAACQMLAISRTFLWRLVKDGELPAVRIGKRCLFCLEDLEKFIEDGRQSGGASDGS